MPAKSRSQHSFIQKMYSILFLCFVLLLVSMFSITVFVTYKSQTKLINYSTNLLSDIFTGELEKNIYTVDKHHYCYPHILFV